MVLGSLTSSQRVYLAEATDKYAAALPESEAALSYLEQRGISPIVAHTARLGFVNEALMGHDQYRGWLSIPYDTPSGVVYMKFRRLDDGQPKYLGEGDSRIYNVGALHRSADTIAICEGELDTIILDGVVGIPAIGIPGVSHFKKHYPRLLEGYDRVYVFCDNDDKPDQSNPGMELGKRIVREVPQAMIVTLPKGQDVTECYLSEGADFLRDLVKA